MILDLNNGQASIGTHTGEVVERLFKSVTIKDQAYNSALSVLKLSKTYSNERLENTCEMVFPMTRIPRYKHLKGILASNQDLLYAEQKQSLVKTKLTTETFGYVSGAECYGGIIGYGK